jgi:archaellum biogenesis protein FlaJ (TadC family)
MLDGADADQLAELVQANGLANVELQEHQHRAAQEAFSGLWLGLRHDGMILLLKCESNKTGAGFIFE